MNQYVDALGDMCPIPLLNAKKMYSDLEKNEYLKLVTDHSCVVTNIHEYFNYLPCQITIDEVANGVWEILIIKIR